MSLANHTQQASNSAGAVRHVVPTRALVWLSRGLSDLVALRGTSIAYGVLVTAIGGVILVMLRHPYFIAAAISGFLLVGPILAAGLCELSRRRDAGLSSNFDDSLAALSDHRNELLVFAACLFGIGAGWFLLSSVLLTLGHGGLAPPLHMPLWGGLFAGLTAFQMLSYVLIGGVLAAGVFVLSVVSVPMILDRNVDAYIAIRTSAGVAWANPAAMLIWAVLIVALTVIGYLTFLLALVVIFPVLGHATWHAYRDLVA